MTTSRIVPFPSPKVLAALLCASGAFLLNNLSAASYTFDNGAGTLNWADANNWSSNVIPGTADTATVGSGYNTTVNTAFTVISGNVREAATINVNTGGSLAFTQSGGGFTLFSGGILNVSGGSVSAERITSGSTSTVNNNGSISLSGGTLTATNRLHLINTNTATTTKANFTLSGGTYSGNAVSFRIYGADADDRATFHVIGSAGTWTGSSSEVVLYNTTAGFENSATDVKFTFGTGTTLTTVNAAILTLGGNALTVDFTNIIRPSELTSFSATLFDYGNSSPGSFATPTFVGLGVGESATLVQDTVNRLFRVDFTLAAAQIPEPSTYAIAGGLAVLGLALIRRRRS